MSLGFNPLGDDIPQVFIVSLPPHTIHLRIQTQSLAFFFLCRNEEQVTVMRERWNKERYQSDILLLAATFPLPNPVLRKMRDEQPHDSMRTNFRVPAKSF